MDVGSRTVGIAVSDQLGWTAQGVEIIPINEDEGEFGISRVKELVSQYEVAGFVIGLPKNMNNTEGPRVEAARNYGKLLTKTFGLPIDFQDERLTTVEAERMLIEQADTSRSKRKKVIDKLAASLILENYLNGHGKLIDKLKWGHAMDNEEQKITLVDEHGNEELYNVLFTFDSEDYGRSYVLLYPAEAENDEEVDIQAYAFEPDENHDLGEGELIPIESDEEWDMVEEVLNTFLGDQD